MGRSGGSVPAFLLLFLAWAWLHLAARPSVDGLQNLSVYSAFIAGACVVSLQATPYQVSNLLRTYRISAIFIASIFLISLAVGIPRPVQGEPIYGARAFALVCIVLLAIVIPYRGQNWLLRLSPFFIVAAAFISLSRTAAVVGAVLLTFLAVRIRKGVRWPLALLLSTVVGGGVFWAVTSYGPFRERFLSGDAAAAVGNMKINTSGRSVLWDVVQKSARDSPWIGQGPGSASKVIFDLYPGVGHPHNEYLRLYHDFGIIGLVLFGMGMLVLVFRVARRAAVTDDEIHWVALAALLGVFSAAITDNVIVYPFVMVPLAVIVGCSLAQPMPQSVMEYRILESPLAATDGWR